MNNSTDVSKFIKQLGDVNTTDIIKNIDQKPSTKFVAKPMDSMNNRIVNRTTSPSNDGVELSEEIIVPAKAATKGLPIKVINQSSNISSDKPHYHKDGLVNYRDELINISAPPKSSINNLSQGPSSNQVPSYIRPLGHNELVPISPLTSVSEISHRENIAQGVDYNINRKIFNDYVLNQDDNSKREKKYRRSRKYRRGSRSSSDSDSRSSRSSRSSGSSSSRSSRKSTKHMNTYDLAKVKRNELIKLDMLTKKGYRPYKKFTLVDDYNEMKNEREILDEMRKLHQSIEWMRECLIMTTWGTEKVNGIYDPFDIYLDGWNDALTTDITKYDDVFEELYYKYKDTISTAPEIKLLLIWIGSGISFHMQHKIMEKAKEAMPGFAKVMGANPQLKKDYLNTSQNIMKQEGNLPSFGMPNIGTQQVPHQQHQSYQVPPHHPHHLQKSFHHTPPHMNHQSPSLAQPVSQHMTPPNMVPPHVGTHQQSSLNKNLPKMQTEMAGPSGLDNILKQLDTGVIDLSK